jgi:hypothetical protein
MVEKENVIVSINPSNFIACGRKGINMMMKKYLAVNP